MVRQIQGSYKVKNEGLRPLYEEALELLGEFDGFTIRHVARGQNRRADELCNQALDAAKPAKTSAPAAKAAKKKSVAQRPDVREQAVDCLRSVAAAWARGDANNPKPEQVWDQLWTILEEGGVLR
jgi:ribonuclease HI